VNDLVLSNIISQRPRGRSVIYWSVSR